MANAAKKDEDKVKGNDLTVPSQYGLPSISEEEAALYAEDAGAGLETITMRDKVIPYLKIIQQLSPELNKNKPEYIEDLEIGDFLNSATKQIYKELRLIPVSFIARLVEWKPKRGGFVADHGDINLEPAKRVLAESHEGKDANGNNVTMSKAGNILQEQKTFFCLEISGAFPERAVVSLASTQIKHGKEWATKIDNELIQLPGPDGVRLVKPPIWYRSYTAESQPESNDRGDWMGWKIRSSIKTVDIPEIGKMFYKMSKAFHDDVKAGLVKAEVEDPASDARGEDAPF